MAITAYPVVDTLLDQLLGRMRAVLGDKLIGLYLYGSLVTGDFDIDISDVDLLAAIATDLDAAEFAALEAMHESVVTETPQWTGRLEIAYVPLHGLMSFKTERSAIAVISPGEPFHMKDAGIDWLTNWYTVREKGRTLYGPASVDLIASISRDEFIEAVKSLLRMWPAFLDETTPLPYLSYSILTLCRGLYTITFGEPTSKIKAAAWATGALPDWSLLIHNALVWRKAPPDARAAVDRGAVLADTRRFMRVILDRVETH